jgi:enoyl-CoA hydratase/carnithine racemase
VPYEDLLFEKDGHVLTLTLNRPERMNALGHRLLKVELPDAFRAAREDAEVRVVIVTGAGEKAFCSGADLKDAAETGSIGGTKGPSQGPYYRGTPTDFMRDGFDKPVVVAVNGMCLGAGLHFVADGDLVLCADHATFFDTHVRVGQVFALEAIGLIRRIPFGEVMRMMLLSGAERLDAQTALRLGLVSEVVPRADLLPARAPDRGDDRRVLAGDDRGEQARDVGRARARPRRRPRGGLAGDLPALVAPGLPGRTARVRGEAKAALAGRIALQLPRGSSANGGSRILKAAGPCRRPL